MLESFRITFFQTLVLFAFIAIGYIMKKTNKVSAEFNKGISNLLVYIFLPCLIIGSMAKNFKLDVLYQKANLIIIATLLLGSFVLMAFIFSRIFAKSQNTCDVYMYSFTFPNSGYIGNPLILAIYGELMLFEYMIFCIPFMILTYTFGIYILNPQRKFNLKNLINPPIISMLAGMAIGAANIRLPEVAETIIDMSSNCMAPSAMILTGIVFASNDLKKMVSNIKVYAACLIKMVLIPIIAVFIISAINIPDNLAVMIITMLTLPTGLNSIIFPEAYGGDSHTGAQLCFVSTLVCLVILPLTLALYQFICR